MQFSRQHQPALLHMQFGMRCWRRSPIIVAWQDNKIRRKKLHCWSVKRHCTSTHLHTGKTVSSPYPLWSSSLNACGLSALPSSTSFSLVFSPHKRASSLILAHDETPASENCDQHSLDSSDFKTVCIIRRSRESRESPRTIGSAAEISLLHELLGYRLILFGTDEGRAKGMHSAAGVVYGQLHKDFCLSLKSFNRRHRRCTNAILLFVMDKFVEGVVLVYLC